MMLQKIVRCSALFCAALLGFSAAAMPSAAEIELEEGEYILESDDEDETPTYECGDYTYSRLVSAENSEDKAACIESYSGSEPDLVIPAELDGLPVVQLGKTAFANAEFLHSVTLPKSVSALGVYAFVNCSGLTDYCVEDGNPYFESRDGVLYGYDGKWLERYPLGRQPEEYTVPEGIIGVGDVAFATSTSLAVINLPDSLEEIGAAAFSDCPKLLSITIPSGVTEVSDFMCNNCIHLKEVHLPETITRIGYAAFAATELSEFKIPEACTEIGEQAFAETQLAEIIIPSTVQSIGEKAFGFRLDEEGELHKIDGFVVGGELGTAAERYARIGDETLGAFDFVNTGAEETDAGKEKSIVGRIIGIVCCVLALIAVAVIALFSGKKKKAAKAKKSEPAETAETESAEAEKEDAVPEEAASEEENSDE